MFNPPSACLALTRLRSLFKVDLPGGNISLSSTSSLDGSQTRKDPGPQWQLHPLAGEDLCGAHACSFAPCSLVLSSRGKLLNRFPCRQDPMILIINPSLCLKCSTHTWSPTCRHPNEKRGCMAGRANPMKTPLLLLVAFLGRSPKARALQPILSLVLQPPTGGAF